MRISILEHGISGYKSIGTRCSKQLAGLYVNASVDLNESL
jgi:hypothetical protein